MRTAVGEEAYPAPPSQTSDWFNQKKKKRRGVLVCPTDQGGGTRDGAGWEERTITGSTGGRLGFFWFGVRTTQTNGRARVCRRTMAGPAAGGPDAKGDLDAGGRANTRYGGRAYVGWATRRLGVKPTTPTMDLPCVSSATGPLAPAKTATPANRAGFQ